GLCPALGANELLGRHCHHQSVLGDPGLRAKHRDAALGGFTVDNPTLVRFYSLHYLLPFVIVAVVFLHLIALHQHGSNNPRVIAMFGSIFLLFQLPWLDTSSVRSARFRPIYKSVFWLLLFDCLVLGWVGGNPPEGKFILIGRLATLYCFVHFLVILPLLSKFERPLPIPPSISEAVLKETERRAVPVAGGS